MNQTERALSLYEKEIEKLRAENKELRAEITNLDALIDHGVLAEIGRLRAAVRWLLDVTDSMVYRDTSGGLHYRFASDEYGGPVDAQDQASAELVESLGNDESG